MSRDYKKIISEVKRIVKAANDSPKNKYGKTVWPYHLELVVRYALALGRKLKTDLEVLELAAYLHDFAALKEAKNDKEHHIIGARLAGELLAKLGLEKEKIAAVKECILRHRGSVPLKKKTLEAKIISSADAMSHFYYIPDMFFLAYGVHRLETDEGARWLMEKLRRSYKKIMPEGREMIKKDKKIFFEILNQILKNEKK